jgi:hypothetical protein
MEITISIAGEQLDSRSAAKQLHLIAGMVKAGIVEMDGFSAEFLGAFSVNVDFESNGGFDLQTHHHSYVDGEGSFVHVNGEGTVVFRRTVVREGVEQIEQLFDQGIKLDDWAKEHGGITPYHPGQEIGEKDD